MRKLIAGLMILLMTMSVIPLQSSEKSEFLGQEYEPSFVNGPEVELVSLNTISDNQTFYNGDLIPFNVLIANSGTTFIYDVSVTVEIWKFDESAGSNDTIPFTLTDSWVSNPVCNEDDDGDGVADCPYQIINPSDVIDDGSGSYTLPGVTWLPDVGLYQVRVMITVDDDTDLSNNMIQYSVVVLEWFDLEVSTAWQSSGSDTIDMGATQGIHNFVASVSARSSADSTAYSLRNVTLKLEVTGANTLTDVNLDSGNSTLNASGITSFYTSSPSEIYIDTIGYYDDVAIIGQVDGGEVIAPRYVVEDRTTYSFTGSVETDGTEGAIHVSVSLVSYSVYDSVTPLLECIVDLTNISICEGVGRTTDKDGNNDFDVIHAYNGVVHDVQLNTISVRSNSAEISTGLIGVGNHTITVNASHTGSDPSQHYHVNVSVEMSDELGNVIGNFGPYNSCEGDPITLGSPEESLVTQMAFDICFNLDFYPGDITLTVTLTLDDGGTDVYLVNNVVTGEFEVFNEDPIAHLILEPPEDLLVGSNVLIYGFSVDSDNYLYDFSYTFYRVDEDSTETEIVCTNPRNSTIPNCAANVDSLWLSTAAIKIVVEDFYGGIGTSVSPIDVWATKTIKDLDSTFMYSMVYKASSEYTASVAQSQSVTGQDLPMIPGKHDSLAVWDYSSTSEDPLINRHELVLTYPRSAEGDGTLWFMGEGLSEWELVDDSAVSSTSQTTQSIRWTDVDGTEDPISSGKYAVFATDAGAPPKVAVNGLVLSNSVGGGIQLNWDIVGGSFEADDRLVISYSSGTNALDGDDAATDEIVTDSVKNWRLSSALHGQTYYFLLCVENDNGVNVDGCDDASIVADSMVSPVPTVTNLKIEAIGETQLKVSWDATQTEDVERWKVCMGMSKSATNQCFTTTGPVSEKVLSKPTQKVRWFFNIYAEDNSENMANVGSTSVDLSDPNALDAGIGGPVLGSAEEGQVPMWAFGLIGAVVVLSIIIGAVIISRGSGDDDDDQWDY